MHRNNKQWKMKWGQNLRSLKYQRSLPVGFAGSKTVQRDRIVADTWLSYGFIWLWRGREPAVHRQGSASGQPHSPHWGGRARAGDVAQHVPAQGVAGGTQSLPWTRGQTGTAMPQAAICWAHAGEKHTQISGWYLHWQLSFPCPALQVKTYTSPLWDHSYD